MTFAYWDIADGGTDLHEHGHEQEEVWHIIEGEIVLTIEGEERHLRPGMAAIIPSYAHHSARVLGPCRALVADHPLRPNLPGGSN